MRLTGVAVLLRGALVNRTYGVHKNPYISPFLPTIFGPVNYAPPRNRSSAGCRYSARIVGYTAHTGTIEGPLLHSMDGAAKKYRLKTQTTACPNVRVRPDERVRAIGIHASDRS